MTQVHQNICLLIAPANTINFLSQIVLMLVLLAASAFFSGCETAFFNLSPRQIKNLQKSRHKLQLLTCQLLRNPKRLLSCFLLGNMIVNVLFFAVVSVFALKVKQQVGPLTASAVACMGFLILVLFSIYHCESYYY